MRENKKYFSKLGFYYLFATLIISVTQGIVPGILSVLAPQLLSDYDIYLASAMIPMYVLGFPLAYLLIGTIKTQEQETIVKHTMTVGQLLGAICTCYTIMIVGNLVGIGLTAWIGTLKGSSVSNPFVELSTTGNMWFMAFYTVICAPFFEELLFRKFLIDRCIRYGQWVAVLVSGVLFGFMHGNLNQMVYAVPMGMFMAFIYVKTGQIKYTILIHMSVNFLGSVVGNLITTYTQEESMARMILQSGYSCGMILLLAIGGVLLIKNRRKFSCTEGIIVLPKEGRMKTIFMNVGMGIYIVVWLAIIMSQLFT